ncbi:MAG: leucine--tRNA ligase [Chloroflexi bacterium]|nr:leucine--tRNA ligase [Chloroflexota bacterium]MCI0575828.1 leucine--tRNA ligase [Chloroflexota bacterium]MCI0646555.1 leucine--tRNA ligase [Chloroflexota bacterium]MCI0726357.1 leucine--tRNA ligase [Chloroflexota bacterium]
MINKYDFKALEEKWRPVWKAMELYRTGDNPEKPKYYILDFFPYPSGDGLSVGHCRNYVPTCVSARFKRMQGYNVLHPMGWDAFGLPAENYAIQHGVHPRITTDRQVRNYRRQCELVECSYDWAREINSTDPAYYRWTQWFFLLLHKHGLAYRAMGSQWWCPKDQTILANEQVERGRCWRCGSLVTRKDLEQWYFKITDYADRLLADLDTVEWPESIKMMQRNWIGRSEGYEVTFTAGEQAIPVFTTRLDTLFGATFLVLAPEHPLVQTLTTAGQQAEVGASVEAARRMADVDRLAAGRDEAGTISGVFTGATATHPLTGQPLPIWVADYILTGYGTGAVMGVPGHDSRDFALARRYNLPVIRVVRPAGSTDETPECFTEPGVLVNSGPYTGLTSAAASERMAADLAGRGLVRPQVMTKMRDWLISRQRYWGAPIPMIHCPACGIVPVPEEELPVLLPDVTSFAPSGDGRSPLAMVEEWVNVTCPQCGGPARRETDTMDGFACSSWYFLRFASPHEDSHPFDPAAVAYWLPVDTYVGGAEHAVMHLLYARFWTKVMYDAGLISFVEPFSQLRNQGVLHAADGRRMSKSRGNVVTPDEVIAEHGTDALRSYILFIGPFEGDTTWDGANIKGVDRFLERYWTLAHDIAAWEQAGRPANGEVDDAFRRRLHQVIRRVTGDFEQFKFNTAVAALMEYLNELYDRRQQPITPAAWREALETFTRLLCPIAPFITEEIWQEVLGHQGQSVHQQPWPIYDEALATAGEMTIMVQVNGRLRDRITVPAGITDEALQQAALARPNIQRHVNGQTIQKVVVVPGQVVNIVVS